MKHMLKQIVWFVLFVFSMGIAAVWSPFSLIFGLMWWGWSTHFAHMHADHEHAFGNVFVAGLITGPLELVAVFGNIPVLRCRENPGQK